MKRATSPPLCLRSAAILLVASSFSGAVMAAAPQTPNYNIGDAMKDAAAPRIPGASGTTPPAPILIQQDDSPMSLTDGETIAVRDFQVLGADFLTPGEIDKALAAYRNRELHMSEINEAASRITALCRGEGYLIARAYVPKQTMQEQRLIIQVIVGKYGHFGIKNNSLVKDSFILDVFDGIRGDDARVNQSGLERALLLVGDMPGSSLPTVSVSPGEQPGTSDFLVQTNGGDRVNAYLTADNYGSELTGKDRLNGGVFVNSLFGYADRLSLTGMASDGPGLQNGRAAYAIPIGARGLRVEVGAAKTTYQLGALYKDLDASGTSYAIDTTLSYPLMRTREDSFYISLNLADKRLRDDIGATDTTTDKRAKVATLSLQRETYRQILGFSAYLNVLGSVTTGRLSFEDEAQKQLNQAGANTAGRYSKVNLAYTGNFSLNERWTLLTGLQAQKSLGKNLDGSEQFSASGPTGIKSYPYGVVSDNGYLLNAEIKYALGAIGNIEQAVGLFTNYAEVGPQDGSYTTIGKIAISDVGLSYAISNKTFFGRLQISQTLGTQAETKEFNNDHPILLQFGVKI